MLLLLLFLVLFGLLLARARRLFGIVAAAAFPLEFLLLIAIAVVTARLVAISK